MKDLCDGRRKKMDDNGDLLKLLNMVRKMMIWMEDVVRKMKKYEKNRDVSGVELMMNKKKSLKEEIDEREDKLNE